MQQHIAFIGAGNMAKSLIGGLIAQGTAANQIWATNRSTGKLDALKNEWGIHTTTDNNEAVKHADIIVLAVKPQMLKDVCHALKDGLRSDQLIVSVVAGIQIASLADWLGNGEQPIVRTMPNTPSLIQLGATGAYANTYVSASQKEAAHHLLCAVGIAMWVDEEPLLDAVTAVSGSGPAYYFLMMEAMQAAGESLGLSAEQAKALTLQTALGAAAMANQSTDTPATLRKNVTSPGGTTEQALNTFEQAGYRDIVKSALNAADSRAKELAALLGK